MLFGHFVTLCAIKRHMVRQHLYVRNIAMARGAFRRGERQLRIVRVMARHTRFTWIVALCNYLGKTGRSRRVIAVTQRTKVASLWLYRQGSERIIDMFRRRTMTRLAGNSAVIGTLLGLEDVIMAISACLVTGVCQRLVGVLKFGIGPVMSMLAKCLWHIKLPNHEQAGDENGEDDYQRS